MILISENIKQITDTWWEPMYDPVSDSIVKVSVQQEVKKRLPYKVSDKWDSNASVTRDTQQGFHSRGRDEQQ